MVVDHTLQVTHASINEVVLGLKSLSKVTEDMFDLGCLLDTLVGHVAHVKLAEKFIFGF